MTSQPAAAPVLVFTRVEAGHYEAHVGPGALDRYRIERENSRSWSLTYPGHTAVDVRADSKQRLVAQANAHRREELLRAGGDDDAALADLRGRIDDGLALVLDGLTRGIRDLGPLLAALTNTVAEVAHSLEEMRLKAAEEAAEPRKITANLGRVHRRYRRQS